MKERDRWLDIGKGLGILLVVVGHSGKVVHGYMFYWAIMPLFMVASGYLFRPVSSWPEFRLMALKRAQQLLIPYLACLFVITLGRYGLQALQGNHDVIWYVKDLAITLFGGRVLRGPYTAFWFITCLFATQILFAAITVMFKEKRHQIIIIAVMYVAAHLEAMIPAVRAEIIKIPWNIDVSLMAIAFFSIGYYLKPYLKKIPIRITAVLTAVSAVLLGLNVMGYFEYTMDMKYVAYDHIVLDFILTNVLVFAVFGLFQLIDHFKVLNIMVMMGNYSLVIMYLHFVANTIVFRTMDYSLIEFVLVGITVPILVAKALERFPVTRRVFLGIR
ncbi:MAG: acyltransferase family protein [Firmicutes bacterium]|nr:acyltransferase family protein [Bacillota bacterium]